MATEGNERYLRYYLLIGKGGLLILRGILERETNNTGRTLDILLKENEPLFKRRLPRSGYMKLYPRDGILDVCTWDITLSTTVILQLFRTSLTIEESNAITNLRDLRNEVVHDSSTSMDKMAYEKCTKELEAILLKLCEGLNRSIRDECHYVIKECSTGPIEKRKENSGDEEIVNADLGSEKLEFAPEKLPAVLARIATEKDLQRVAMSVGSNWEMLGPYLLKQNAMAKVEQIKADHPHKTEMRIYNLLLTWREHAAPDTTLCHLFHQMLQVGTSVAVEWRTIAKYLDIDERDIRACKKGYQPPVQERSTNPSVPGKKGYQPPVQERSTNPSIPGISRDIEIRVRDLREEIVRCIKEPTIVSHLEARSVISTEDSSRIKNLYLRDETYKAGEDLLECVLSSREPGKWKSFLDALESADYHHLKALLLSNNNFDEFSAHVKTVMRLFTPYLEKIVIAKEFVSELRARDVINGADEEVILAMFANKGDIYSTMVLLERMQCRVAPQKWYYDFLDVLMKKGHQQIVQEMEPDFIANPSSFMPQSDFVQQYMDTADQSAPPPIPPLRQDLLIYSRNSKQGENNTLYQTRIEEIMNEGNDDEEVSTPYKSDYEEVEAQIEAISAHAPLKLRKYQLELAENAILGRNTIICAETGSGKPLVALHIVQKHLQQTGNGPRKVVFMANTGVLTKQQSDMFQAYLPAFKTKLITEDDDGSRMVNVFVENYDILCLTPQILVNNLEDKVIKSLSEFSLFILDECHRTIVEGPYSLLMRKYMVEKNQTGNEMPQVVGLTASIGVDKSRTDQEAVEYILRVCACLDVRLLSTVERNLTELKKHINMPDEGQGRKKGATAITVGSDKVVKQERTNAYKASMMYRALHTVKHLDPNYFDMKVNLYQKEEMHKYRFKTEVEKKEKERKSDEDYEILCGRCNTFACYVSDVRQLGHDHIVIDKAFADKITRKEHKKPKTYDGLHKKYKMFCKKCSLDWGIIGIRDGLACMILKIMHFKKWIGMPYSVPEITLEDLPRLIGLLPEEILKMDDSSISLYLEALKDGMTDVNNIRVMIVGHCGVGKTTLTKRLFGEHVDLRQEIERTNGIEVHVQRCKVQLPEGIWLPLTEGDSQENYYNRIASIMIESSKKAKSDKEEEWSQFGETDKSLQKLPPEQLAENSKSDKAIAKKEEPVAIHKHDDSGPTMNQSTSRSDDAPYNHDVSSHEQRIRIQELVHEVVTCSSADFFREDNTADLSVWDFAGQHVFYGTHQVFLSKRAVYLLVTDLSGHVDNIVDDECFIDSNGETRCKISDFVAFWLNSIHSYCESEKSGEPPVILIGTFADKLDKEKKQELAGNFFTKLREVLVHSAAYDHLECENFTIDNSVKDPNVELLKQKIVEIATKQSYWNELYPSRWVLLEQSLMEFKKRGIQVLNRRILEETNKKLPVPIQSTSELDLFLRYHHETGFILYFSDENLKDYILLEPQWLVDALRSLITARQFCEKKASFFKTWLDFDSTALLKRELIDAVWEVGTPFHEHKDLILDYMEKLGIIARPRHSLQCVSMEDFYIAPCVLKQTVPDRLLEFSVGDCKSTSRLCFSTASKIIPVQVFHKLIADCITRWPISQHKSAYQIFCGCCMFDVDNLHMLYVYFRDSVIQIWITKYSKIEPEPDINVCIAVKEFVEQHLHNTLRGSCELETYVKCPHANIKLPDHWWKVDELSENKEVRCNSHDPRIVLTTSELMKYWDPQHADQMEVYPETFLKSIPNEKQLSQMAQRIGKEYRSLGLVLGLSEVKLDHLDMDEQRHAPADKITAMLNTWVKLKSPNATFGELKHAMSCTGLDWMNIFKGL